MSRRIRLRIARVAAEGPGELICRQGPAEPPPSVLLDVLDERQPERGAEGNRSRVRLAIMTL